MLDTCSIQTRCRILTYSSVGTGHRVSTSQKPLQAREVSLPRMWGNSAAFLRNASSEYVQHLRCVRIERRLSRIGSRAPGIRPRCSTETDKRATSAEEPYTSVPSTPLKETSVVESSGPAAGGNDPELTAVERGELTRVNALRIVDKCLQQGDEEKALAIVRSLQGRPGGLNGFGNARQVPQRIYTLDELRLHKIEAEKFLSPTDSTLGGVRRTLQIALLLGVLAAWQAFHLDQMQLLGLAVVGLFIGTADQIANGGGGEALILDTIGHATSANYRNRVAEHEAGHFLVSYLVGILPRAYTLSSLDALRRYGALNLQAGTTFADADFQREAASGKLSSGTLDRFTCVALAGVATEYLKYGVAEGGLSDIQQLDNLFKSIGFTQKKADSQVRWGVLNTVTLLRRHNKVHKRLVTAMKASKPVGECIDVIETALEGSKEI